MVQRYGAVMVRAGLKFINVYVKIRRHVPPAPTQRLVVNGGERWPLDRWGREGLGGVDDRVGAVGPRNGNAMALTVAKHGIWVVTGV